MTKRKTVEVIEEFDDSGKLIRKTTTETTEDEDTNYSYNPWWSVAPYTYPNPGMPTVQYGADSAGAGQNPNYCRDVVMGSANNSTYKV